MAARTPSPDRLAAHEELRQSSGWYLAAWRDYRSLTLEELADAVGTSKGVVSDLENGKPKRDGSKPLRFNRDWVDLMAKALGTTGGHLIDVNPYSPNTDTEAVEKFRKVAPQDRGRLLQIMDTFAKGAADR